MTVVAANELKRRGVSVLERALAEAEEATITVHGKQRCVVMTTAHYEMLRECELAAAVAEARADIAAGRARTCTVAEHMAEVPDSVTAQRTSVSTRGDS